MESLVGEWIDRGEVEEVEVGCCDVICFVCMLLSGGMVCEVLILVE